MSTAQALVDGRGMCSYFTTKILTLPFHSQASNARVDRAAAEHSENHAKSASAAPVQHIVRRGLRLERMLFIPFCAH
jgi:hypothetical protein